MRFNLFTLAALAAFTCGASAIDLGVKGRQFDITEPDFRQRLAKELTKANSQQIKDQIKKSSDTWADNLPDYGLPQSQETSTRWIDPSFVVEQDIFAPVQRPDGVWENQMLYPKGTQANPLDYVAIKDRFLIVRADSDWQIQLADQAAEKFGNSIKIVLAQGNPIKLSKIMHRPVYYLNPLMMSRFQLAYTPSLVGIGDGTRSKFLAVTRFEHLATVKDIERGWYGIK